MHLGDDLRPGPQLPPLRRRLERLVVELLLDFRQPRRHADGGFEDRVVDLRRAGRVHRHESGRAVQPQQRELEGVPIHRLIGLRGIGRRADVLDLPLVADVPLADCQSGFVDELDAGVLVLDDLHRGVESAFGGFFLLRRRCGLRLPRGFEVNPLLVGQLLRVVTVRGQPGFEIHCVLLRASRRNGGVVRRRFHAPDLSIGKQVAIIGNPVDSEDGIFFDGIFISSIMSLIVFDKG